MQMYFRFIQATGLAILLSLAMPVTVKAQHVRCGFDQIVQALIQQNPHLKQTIDAVRKGEHNNRAVAKTTVDTEHPVIPVVFHVILNQVQINSLGGTQGIEARIKAQVDVLNECFNARNADSMKILDGFKPLFANSGVSFGLAHTAPDGSATPGYEVRVIKQVGFNIDGGWGSGFGFSAAKYAQGEGLAAWDVQSYLNIWVINPMDNNNRSDVLGLAVPPYLTTDNSGIDQVEEGVILHYGVLGNKDVVPGVYIKGSERGRTLTHEVGHMFELLHTWGDDDGKCPWNGGSDDGIADTPPQASPSFNCHTGVVYDGCTSTGNGIMYMNYMDYSGDDCLLMFTPDQVGRMRHTFLPGAGSYSLTQQPWLLDYPNGQIATNNYVVYPNPADDVLNISFTKQAQGLKGIRIVDMLGRVVARKEYTSQSAFYSFSTAGLYAGVYFVVFSFDSGNRAEKVLVR